MWQKVQSNVRKKTAELLQREEETPYPEIATGRGAPDPRDPLCHCWQGTRARFQTVQAKQAGPGERDRVFSRQRLSGDTETAQQ